MPSGPPRDDRLRCSISSRVLVKTGHSRAVPSPDAVMIRLPSERRAEHRPLMACFRDLFDAGPRRRFGIPRRRLAHMLHSLGDAPTPIREFLVGHKFDPETTRLMGVAFEIVLAALQLEGRSAVAHEAIAKRIIALALDEIAAGRQTSSRRSQQPRSQAPSYRLDRRPRGRRDIRGRACRACVRDR